MKLHVLRHEPFEGLAAISEWIKHNNYSVSTTHTYLNQEFPAIDDFDMLIIMGGTASVYDHSEAIHEEKAFIKEAIAKNKKILGICLGAQFLAAVMGASVYPGKEKEIGWFPIRHATESRKLFPFLPEQHTVFHWHGDTFDIPIGATPLACSAPTPNQGFIAGKNILALQYHLEMTSQSIPKIVKGANGELLQNGSFIQSAEQILSSHKHFEGCKQLLFQLLDHFTQM